MRASFGAALHGVAAGAFAFLLVLAGTALGAVLVIGQSRGLLPNFRPRHMLPIVSSARQDCGWDGPPRMSITAQDAAHRSNPLWTAFDQHRKGPIADKWLQYFDIYHRYFQRFQGRPLTFLEIGVQSGGTIGMWQSYFGEAELTYFGIDIDEHCRELFDRPPRVNIITGDQGSPAFWQKVARQNPKGFDVVLDDGGHQMRQQIATFEGTWDMLKPGGVYICEDTATSMDLVYGGVGQQPYDAAAFGGGYGKNTTWFEYAKRLADYVQGHYISRERRPEFDPHNRTSSMLSVAFYDQMVVLEKGPHPRPFSKARGSFRIPYGSGPADPAKLAKYKQERAASLAP